MSFSSFPAEREQDESELKERLAKGTFKSKIFQAVAERGDLFPDMSHEDISVLMSELDPEEEYLLGNRMEAMKEDLVGSNGMMDDQALRWIVRDHITYESRVNRAVGVMDDIYSEILKFKASIKIEQSKNKQQMKDSESKAES